MQSPTNYSGHADDIAGYLADREGLQGAARRVFVRELHEVFGFRRASMRRIASLFLGLALMVAGFGAVFELLSGCGGSAVLVWLGVACLGAALARAITLGGLRARAVNHELEWRAYCLLIRPLIVRRRQGLLDRNLSTRTGTCEVIDADHWLAIRAAIGEWKLDCWVPAGAGWALGAVGAVVWRLAAGPSMVGILGLPICGTIVGPLVWTVFRLSVFRRLSHAATQER